MLRTAQDVEAARDLLLSVPWYRIDPQPDYFAAVAHALGPSVRPHVVVAERPGASPAVLVARLELRPLPVRLGYATLIRPTLRAVVVVPGGASDEDDEAASRLLVQALETALVRGEAHVAVLPNVRVGSELYRALASLPAIRREGFQPVRTHYRLRLRTTFDELLASMSRSTRYDVRRCRKGVEGAFGDRLGFTILRSPGDLERILEDLDSVAAATYQRRLGVGFASDGVYRRRVELGLERGWYRAFVVSIDDRPVAFVDGFVWNGTFFFSSTGYDPSLRRHRLGIYVQIRKLEALCEDPDVQSVDYGSGDAEYKRRFADESWQETEVIVYGPTVRALVVNAVRSGVSGVNALAQAVLARYELERRVKSLWRRRLARPRA